MRIGGALTQLIVATAIGSAAPQAIAQAWPSRPITLIEPFAAGGAVDAAVRAIAEKAALRLGQPIVVDARPGGGTRIGTDAIKRAAPDGYTVGVMVSASGVNLPALDPRITYDPLRDFTPLTLAFDANFLIAVNPRTGIKTLAELIDTGRKQPGKLSYGSSGIGTSSHLWMEILQASTNAQYVHVPYKGESASLQDLVAGNIEVMLTNPILAKQYVDAGRLVALAYASNTRSPVMPDVPTTAEADLKDYVAGGWVAFIAPANLPREIANRLSSELRTAMTLPDVRERIERANFTVRALPPDAFAAQMSREIGKLRAVGKARGIVIND
jgi:tripartite-type tricarboxylate transporter receptor subunit TctC